LVLPPSKAVPMLMSACATGKIFREAQVHGGWEPDSTAFLKVRLLDVMVSSFQTSALSGEAVLQVSIALNFEKIEMEIAPRDISGKLGAAVSAGWDRKRNRRS
jgi:type VI secretion system secreted protein Hcp